MTRHSHSHGHAHSHGPSHGAGAGTGTAAGTGTSTAGASAEPDWEALAAHLEREAELSMPFLEEAAAWLHDLAGRHEVTRILDLGSGPGVTTTALAHAFPGAETVAVDGAPGLLERARARAGREGLADRVTVRQAELPEDLPDLGTAELIWTSNVVHHLGDQGGALETFAAALRPGGVLAVREGGLPARFLPRDIGMGRPGLQARMDAAQEEWFATMRAELPGHTRTVEDWPALLAGAGLAPTGSRTFLTDLPAPLDPAARAHVRGRVERVRENLADGLPAEDLETLDALLDDGSPEGLARRADVFFLTATTVHTAVRA
ncbi:methyltransferase domain-containing protein [Streptomyces sp. NBC_01795]|uniref:class I SAM-dependent methyltransferase n=1 Tax=unclassified Streptomyces TaxID=2593676 RepID=UPI002DD937F8|nr:MULTISPECIES: methyltransferase [unclassified Streptomyces]WSA92776.1 methyltransferase domain-containing protein [Streptomyces sp. NBC_01795]WSS14588.1 methyltransferase domain-containing protein [Streptomyces sp. NBC_01186]